ncbi:LUD domain-containing protein [Caldicellulosiruptor acetigenus]|nr:LUD domain-containing protein [Caldicellulosiruptor acetigenus]
MRQSLLADVLVTGTNAITKNGTFINVDYSNLAITRVVSNYF